MANLLANFLTIASLLFGFVSIIFSLENQFTLASWAIITSVILDGLDGQVARRNPVPSEFGKQLDSLVDVVTFGIAPAVLGYIFVYRDFHFWATAALFIYLVSSVMRLAKYNVTPKEKMPRHFCGLPTTASGGVLASFILVYRRYTQSPPPLVFLLLVILLAYLMVSRIRYVNLDGLKQVFRGSADAVVIVLSIIFLSFIVFNFLTGRILPEITVFALFVLYLFSPLFAKNLV